METKDEKTPEPPKKVTMPIRKATIMDRIQGKTHHEIKEPFVLLIKQNLDMILIENVKKGYLELGNQDIKKRIELTPSKMVSWEIGNGYKKGWVAYENEMQAYPKEAQHDAETFYKIIQKVTMNYKEFEERAMKAKAMLWLIIAGGAVVVLYFVAKSGLIDKLINRG